MQPLSLSLASHIDSWIRPLYCLLGWVSLARLSFPNFPVLTHTKQCKMQRWSYNESHNNQQHHNKQRNNKNTYVHSVKFVISKLMKYDKKKSSPYLFCLWRLGLRFWLCTLLTLHNSWWYHLQVKKHWLLNIKHYFDVINKSCITAQLHYYLSSEGKQKIAWDSR